MANYPHRRVNPLTDEYVLVSPQRSKRPWLGQVEPANRSNLPSYDPSCYLCPGNDRSGGQTNPAYDATWAFENDFPAVLSSESPPAEIQSHPLLRHEAVHGACDVVLYHPRHDITMARMKPQDIEHIIEEWKRLYESRGKQSGIEYVQIFENKGAMMGCSNPHPHGQIWSLSTVPTLPAREIASLRKYATSGDCNPCLLCDYVQHEISEAVQGARVIYKNEQWTALVPWWACWPFEMLVLPHNRHVSSIAELLPTEVTALADVLSVVTVKYDNLFSTSFPYSMGIHQRPLPPLGSAAAKPHEHDVCHLHFHFYPPLLRSATVRKFLVGFEMLGEAQRDLTPEDAAGRLRECSREHYLDAEKGSDSGTPPTP